MMEKDDVIGPFNLGNPVEFTVKELAEKVVKLTGSKSKIVYMPLPKDDPLWDAPNIIITPHVSGNMSLDVTRGLAVDMFCKNLERYARGDALHNVVDLKIGY